MRWPRTFMPAAAVALALLGACADLGSGAGERLYIDESHPEIYVLVTPGSRLGVGVPKKTWHREDPDRPLGPRYFYFSGQEMILSGWFETAEKYKGLPEYWQSTTTAWRAKGISPPLGTRFGTLGPWQTIDYDSDVGQRGVTNSHLRAERVQAGTWLDVHLSTTTRQSSAANHQHLAAALKDLFVTTLPSAP